MRPSDRFESSLWLLVMVMLLVAIPVAGAIGTSSYSAVGERIRAERSLLTAVTATVRESPARSTIIGPRGYAVESRWRRRHRYRAKQASEDRQSITK